MLRLRGRRCVVVGGGTVGLQRAQTLCEAGAEVVVVAPQIEPPLEALPIDLRKRAFEPADLEGAFLAVVATGDQTLNRTIAEQAAAAGVLVSVADAPDASDLHFMAQARQGPVTLAVHTGGVSAAAAAAIRDQLSNALDSDWPRLLAIAAPCRGRLQDAIRDPAARRAALRRLTDPAAMAILKRSGDDALRRHLDEVIRGAADADAASDDPSRG